MITVGFSRGFLPPERLTAWQERCSDVAQHLLVQQEEDHLVASPYRSLTMPAYAHVTHSVVQQIVGSVADHPDIVVLVGIGGSSLGAQAVYQALACMLPVSAPELWVIDTIDPVTTRTWLQKFHHASDQRKNIVLVVVSKSGTTLETSCNSELFIDALRRHLQRHGGDVCEHLVIISDEGSPLHTYAQAHNLPYAAIPTLLGGRFSLFSVAGIVPLALLGFNTTKLLQGAQCAMVSWHTSSDVYKICAFLTTSYECGLTVHDLFMSAPYLLGVGVWYRQLCAESLGKQAADGTRYGLLPTVSCISSDLHSVVQLYLAGPRRTVTTFIEGVDSSSDTDIALPSGSSVRMVHNALCQAIRKAYDEQELPYIHIRLHTTPEAVGFLLQYHIIAVVLLGHLWKINPFDQPQVELYKKWVRRALI